MEINEKNNIDIYNIAPCYFFSFSNEGFITRINDIFLSRLGYESGETIHSKKLAELLTVGSKIFFQTHFYPLIKLHGKADEIFLSFLTKSKEEIPVLLNVILKENDGQFEIHCAGLQISNRNRFEEEILQAKHIAEKALLENDELIRLKDELNKNQRSLELRLQRLAHKTLEHQQINTVISHDLQEPLRKVCLFSNQILQASRGLDTKTITHLEKINSAAEKMRMLILNLQQYLSYNTRLPLIAKYDLSELVATAKERAGILPDDPTIRFTQNNLAAVFADRALLIDLFKYLLNNSLKFRNRKNTFLDITIDADLIKQNIFKETENKYEYEYFLRITFTDNGIGFDNKYASAIFELFRKAHDIEGSLGMGLSYCRKIAELHHGFISASSVEDKGTVFTILLPFHDN